MVDIVGPALQAWGCVHNHVAMCPRCIQALSEGTIATRYAVLLTHYTWLANKAYDVVNAWHEWGLEYNFEACIQDLDNVLFTLAVEEEKETDDDEHP